MTNAQSVLEDLIKRAEQDRQKCPKRSFGWAERQIRGGFYQCKKTEKSTILYLNGSRISKTTAIAGITYRMALADMG